MWEESEIQIENHHKEFIMRFQREIETLKTRPYKNKIHNAGKKIIDTPQMWKKSNPEYGEPSPLLHN